MTEPPLDAQQHLGLSYEQLPRHIAIIMDGNGRWARQRGLARIQGHEEGAKVVRSIVTHCARLGSTIDPKIDPPLVPPYQGWRQTRSGGIEALTLFSFSTENWKRPRDEVDFLMGLYVKYLIAERDTIMNNNVRFLHVGRRAGLPTSVLDEMDRTISMSRDNTGLKLCLALNYGSRDEIVDAVRSITERVRAEQLAPSDISELDISNSLYTANLPDPDLLIRTANERRVSNFLLWQISYAEIYISPKLWPEFTPVDLDDAIKDFARRERRFGDVAGKGKISS